MALMQYVRDTVGKIIHQLNCEDAKMAEAINQLVLEPAMNWAKHPQNGVCPPEALPVVTKTRAPKRSREEIEQEKANKKALKESEKVLKEKLRVEAKNAKELERQRKKLETAIRKSTARQEALRRKGKL